MHNQSYVYFITNKHKTVLYVGVTNHIIRRIYEHKNKFIKGFTQKYNLDQLVYYEVFDNILLAIEREKKIKGWSRKKKNDLVNTFNSEWKDLYSVICG